MVRPHLDDLPPLQVPEPYRIRSYEPDDEVALDGTCGGSYELSHGP